MRLRRVERHVASVTQLAQIIIEQIDDINPKRGAAVQSLPRRGGEWFACGPIRGTGA